MVGGLVLMRVRCKMQVLYYTLDITSLIAKEIIQLIIIIFDVHHLI